MNQHSDDLQVDISIGDQKAIIEGKTAVPFKTLVKLILQRKVTALFEKWGSDPMIINSELLTDLASAPQDSQENSRHLIVVTFGCGIFVGLMTFAVLQLVLLFGNVSLDETKLVYIIACMIGMILLGWVIMKLKQNSNNNDQLLETMEKIASVVPRK